MDIIKDLIRKVNEVESGLKGGIYVKNIIKENEAYILDMNTEDQLFEKGVNNLNVQIKSYMPYSQLTISIKRLKGQPYDRVTLRDTGEFHSSFYIEYNDDFFEIKAADEKTDDLIKRYGRYILGLTDENLKILIWEYVYPDIMEKVKKVLL